MEIPCLDLNDGERGLQNLNRIKLGRESMHEMTGGVRVTFILLTKSRKHNYDIQDFMSNLDTS